MNETQTDLNAINIYPNPASDLIAIQLNGLNRQDVPGQLYDLKGRVMMTSKIVPGSTIPYFDHLPFLNGEDLIKIGSGKNSINKKRVELHK